MMLAKLRSTLVDSILARAVALGLTYWLTVVLASELVSPVDKIALFWPPNAIIAAALIFSDRKHWPLYIIVMALAYFVAIVFTGYLPLYVYLGFCAANIIEVLIVAVVVKRFIRTPITHDALPKTLPVVMLASIPASIVSAIIGGTFAASAIEKVTFLNVSVGWFVGLLSGLLLVLPALLAWLAPGAPSVKSYNKGEIIERTAIVALFVGIGLLAPVYLSNEIQVSYVFPYLVFPVLIWTAIRTGIRSATTSALAVGLFAIALTHLGYGPFRFEGLSGFEHVVVLKVGLITITATTVLLAVIVAGRKRTEYELVEKEAQLRMATETMSGGISMLDSDLNFVFFNKQYKEMFGFPEGIVEIGKSIEGAIRFSAESGFHGEGDTEEQITARIAALRNLKFSEVDRSLPNGRTLHLSHAATPGGGVTTIVTDISEKKHAQEALIAAKSEAEAANSAKSEFLASMSHDLRTPLNAILGFADVLSHQYFGPLGNKKYQEYAQDIRASGEHLLELVNDILDLSTIEAGKRSLFKEKIIIEEIFEDCSRIIVEATSRNGILFTTEAPLNPPPLFADRRAIMQILLNLLSNAVKFTPAGGEIKMSAKASKQKITIKVTDTGPGIAVEKLPELMNPFTKAENNPFLTKEGWGLGLAITKSLVDLHDGKIEIKSIVGKGTTVTVTLPNAA